MLANLNEVWKLADEKKIAIGAFNIVNYWLYWIQQRN